jgi:sirohydrochlorin cobaltochelatase
MKTEASTGIILFAHGSRDPNWRLPFEAIMTHLRKQDTRPAVLAYLEFMQPSLSEAVDEMIASGIHEIRVVPVFLAVGSHVRKDLPVLLDEARAKHPALSISATAAIGEQDEIQQAIAAFALRLI